MKRTPPVLILNSIGFLITIVFSCVSQNQQIDKINGLSFVASRDTISNVHILPVKKVNANWTSVMPFGIMRTLDTPELFYNTDRQWYGERYEGSKQSIDLMHSQGLKVMLKPQIWIINGDFTGNINMPTEDTWHKLEDSYENMILLYAKLAQDTGVELYCIGTELNSFISARPKFWKALIAKVRLVYSGKLTYAENWDKFDKVSFWKELDYIGVDAYFPISEHKTPNLEQVKSKWKEIHHSLLELSNTTQKLILFTEFGYRSMDYAGKTPWDSRTISGQVNQEAQKVLLQGLIESTWNKDWFAGGFLWKWFHNPNSISQRHDNRFCVHGKKAEQLLSQLYKKYTN